MSLSKSPKRYTGVRSVLPPDIITATRAPTTADKSYVKGTLWLDTVLQDAFMWPGSGSWISLGTTSSGDIVKLTPSSGSAVTPVSGNVNLTGTANQITVTGTAGTVTYTLPAAIIAPGSIVSTTTVASTTTMTAGTGFTVTDGGIAVNGGDIVNSHGGAGTDVTIEVTNTNNANAASRAGFEVAVGGASAGDPYVNFLVSGAGQYTMGIDNSDSDNFIIAASAALGTSNIVTLTPTGALTTAQGITATTGNVVSTAGDIVSTAGAVSAFTTITAGTGITATSGNITATAGDIISTLGNITATAGDIISTLGNITATAGNITATLGNVVINGAAKQLQVKGGAVTDFIGTATLVNGTVTIANTNIAAADRIFVSRSDLNGSTALGLFDVSITAATSFTIDARKPADATLEAADQSIVDYFIVRQL